MCNYVTCFSCSSSSCLSHKPYSGRGRLIVEVSGSHTHTHTHTQQDYPLRVTISSQSLAPTLYTTNTKHPYRQRYSNSRFPTFERPQTFFLVCTASAIGLYHTYSSFSSPSYDRSKTSSKTIPPHTAI